MHGWPKQSKLKGEIEKYAPEASNFTMQEGILPYDDRLFIPTCFNFSPDLLVQIFEVSDCHSLPQGFSTSIHVTWLKQNTSVYALYDTEVSRAFKSHFESNIRDKIDLK